MVGAAGFEPATLCSQSRCATRLRYTPKPNPDAGRATMLPPERQGRGPATTAVGRTQRETVRSIDEAGRAVIASGAKRPSHHDGRSGSLRCARDDGDEHEQRPTSFSRRPSRRDRHIRERADGSWLEHRVDDPVAGLEADAGRGPGIELQHAQHVAAGRDRRLGEGLRIALHRDDAAVRRDEHHIER